MGDRQQILTGQAERVLAEIGSMEAELDNGELTTHGSRGQPVPNPILGQLRAHRWLLVRLLDSGDPSEVTVSAGPDEVDAIRAEWAAVDGT